MSDRLRTVLVLALALIAAASVYRFLSGQRETTTVVIAAVEIPAGTVIDNSMLTQRTVSVSEQDALLPLAIHEPSQVIGRAPKRPIHKGTVLTLDPEAFALTPDALRVATNGVSPPAYLIPPDMVAVSFPVGEDNSVAYSLRPGDLVHVIFTGKGKDGTESRIILTEVKIFAVGGSTRGTAGPYTSITVVLPPADAEKLVLAKRTGQIDLVLTGR